MTIQELLGSINGGEVLDVGTGDGSFIRLLTKHLGEYERIVGIDIDPNVLKEVEKGFSDGSISFEVMSGDALIYEDESFNTVAISNSLHHLKNIKKTLEEMLRVLKPGGHFIVNELVCDGLNDKQTMHLGLHHFQAEIDSLLGIVHNKCFTKEEVTEILNSLELKDAMTAIHENEIFNKYVQIDKLEEYYRNQLDRIKDHPLYEKYREQLNQLMINIRKTGIEFQLQFIFVGKKK